MPQAGDFNIEAASTEYAEISSALQDLGLTDAMAVDGQHAPSYGLVDEHGRNVERLFTPAAARRPKTIDFIWSTCAVKSSGSVLNFSAASSSTAFQQVSDHSALRLELDLKAKAV